MIIWHFSAEHKPSHFIDGSNTSWLEDTCSWQTMQGNSLSSKLVYVGSSEEYPAMVLPVGCEGFHEIVKKAASEWQCAWQESCAGSR